jgi:hypothetical protein
MDASPDRRRHFEFAAVPLPDGNALFTMVDVTDSTRIQERYASAPLRWNRRTGSRPTLSPTSATNSDPAYLDRRLRGDAGGGYAGKLAPAAADYVDAILEAVAAFRS